KLMVTAVGLSSRTVFWNRPAPPLAVSPLMPALRNVSFHSGNRVVRYSSMYVEYWYWAVMLSPRNTMRSPGLKKNSACFGFCDQAAAVENASAANTAALERRTRVIGELRGGCGGF